MNRTVLLTVDLVVGGVLTICGLIAWRCRPKLWEGRILLIVGATWFIGFLPGAEFLHRGALVHLHLGHPTGKLRRPFAVATVAIAWIAAVIESLGRNPWVTLGVAGFVVIAAVDLHRNTLGPARKASVPGLRAALAFAGVLVASSANRVLGWHADLAIAIGYDVVIAALAIFLFHDLLRGAWTDDTLADLVQQVGARPVAGGLEKELCRALGVNSAQIAYRAETGGYVDGQGRPILEQVGDRRFVLSLDEAGQPGAVIIHGPVRDDDQTLLEGARAVAGLAIANTRLDSEIRALLYQVQASRRRIVEAADIERQRFAQDLSRVEHVFLDEIGAHLTALPQAVAASALEELAGLRTDMRELSRGLRPVALSDGGLAAALPAVARRSPVPVRVRVEDRRYPPAVEAALYFLCIEGLTNVARHADAQSVALDVGTVGDAVVATVTDDGNGTADPSRGTGLQGLTDRIAALGGRLTLGTAAAGGTELTARIPLEVAP
jgi:signal transduction histidine kinase